MITPILFSACKSGAVATTQRTTSSILSNGRCKVFNLKIPFYIDKVGKYIAVQKAGRFIVINIQMVFPVVYSCLLMPMFRKR